MGRDTEGYLGFYFFSFLFFEMYFIYFLFVYLFIGPCSMAQAGLELVVLLPQPGECWDYRHVPLHLF
jgi:hypothetical protein